MNTAGNSTVMSRDRSGHGTLFSELPPPSGKRQASLFRFLRAYRQFVFQLFDTGLAEAFHVVQLIQALEAAVGLAVRNDGQGRHVGSETARKVGDYTGLRIQADTRSCRA